MKQHLTLIWVILASFMLATCTADQEPIEVTRVGATAVAPIPLPTTAIPTATTLPTATAVPTQAIPTATVEPTATSQLTALSPDNAAAITQIAQFGKGTIYRTAWSPDGLRFAVASSTGIHLYDAGSLEQISSINSDAPIFDLFFSSLEGTLVVVSETNFWPSVHLWDITTGKSLFGLVEANFVALGADGEIAVTWTGSEMSSTVTLSWQNLLTGEVERTLELPQPPLAYSPVAELFLDFPDPGTISQLRLIDSISGEVRRAIELPVNLEIAAFSPQGNILATSGTDHVVRLWDVLNGELIRLLEGHTNSIGSISFSPDGHLLATSSYGDGHVRLWNITTGELLHILPDSGRLGFSPDGSELAIIDSDRVMFYDITTGRLLHTLSEYSSAVTSITFSPDGKLLAATGGNGKEIRLWDVSSRELIQTVAGDETTSAVAFSPDGRILAWGGNGPLQLYDLVAGRHLEALRGFTGGIFSIVFSPDGRFMAATSWNREGIFWEMDTREQVFSQLAHFHVAFHPDGGLLAIEQNNLEGSASVQIWDMATWQLLRTFPTAGHIFTFTPEGHLLAAQACCDERSGLGLLDVETGQFLKSIEGVGGKAALSPDGRLLAGVNAYVSDNLVLLWDVNSGQRLRELKGHTGLFDIVFSPDGRLLASAGEDGTIRLWGLPPDMP